MPHAPILVPPLGGGREKEAAATMAAMRQLAGEALEQPPELLVIISPHAPRQRDSFGVWTAAHLHGNFGEFGRREIALEAQGAPEAARALRTEAAAAGAALREIPAAEPLDHGTMVPLWFMQEAGWRGATLVLSLPFSEDISPRPMGRALQSVIKTLPGPVVVLASGDMSHRLKPGAPAGYHPRAAEFDSLFVKTLTEAPTKLQEIDSTLRTLAAEDVVLSTTLALEALDHDPSPLVLSYEGPWGVGYTVARLSGGKDGAANDEGAALPEIARASISAALTNDSAPPPETGSAVLQQRRGVFVTLRLSDGALRGCIGSIEPREKNLVAETWRNAREAAFSDPRFPPLRQTELDHLRISVSVLHPPEQVRSLSELDPQRYGIIVSQSRWKRGVLLPNIAGVDSVDDQLRLVRQKAGIAPHEEVRIERFVVDHFEERARVR